MSALWKLVGTLATALAVLGCLSWGIDLLAGDPEPLSRYFGALCIAYMALTFIGVWAGKTFPSVKESK